MKKVFRTKLWLKSMINFGLTYLIERAILSDDNWLMSCEGKTKEEIEELGFSTVDDWFDNWFEEGKQNG